MKRDIEMTGAAALPKELPANHSSEKGLVKAHPTPAQEHCGVVSKLCLHQVLSHTQGLCDQHTALGKPRLRPIASASAAQRGIHRGNCPFPRAI